MKHFLCWLLGHGPVVSRIEVTRLVPEVLSHTYDYCGRCGARFEPGTVL